MLNVHYVGKRLRFLEESMSAAHTKTFVTLNDEMQLIERITFLSVSATTLNFLSFTM